MTATAKPILAGPAKDAADRAALSARYSQRRIDRAYRRLKWLNAWLEALRNKRHGETNFQIAERIAREARKSEGNDFRISARVLQHWDSVYHGGLKRSRGTGIEALIDRYNGGHKYARSCEAIEHFNTLRAELPARSVKDCHEATLTRARRRGWNWPPSYSATRVWLRKFQQSVKEGFLEAGSMI